VEVGSSLDSRYLLGRAAFVDVQLAWLRWVGARALRITAVPCIAEKSVRINTYLGNYTRILGLNTYLGDIRYTQSKYLQYLFIRDQSFTTSLHIDSTCFTLRNLRTLLQTYSLLLHILVLLCLFVPLRDLGIFELSFGFLCWKSSCRKIRLASLITSPHLRLRLRFLASLKSPSVIQMRRNIS
jgi:hypothetical protein